MRPGRTVSSLPTSPVLASSDSSLELKPEEPVPTGSALRHRATRRATDTLDAWRSDGAARWLFIWPTVLLILVLSIFPLIASVALSLSRLAFRQGGVDLKFIGFANYQQLLFGLERSHFLGLLKTPSPIGWAIVIATAALAALAWTRAVRSHRVRPIGLLLRLVGGVLLVGSAWILVQALASDGGRPGALIVTLIFVFAGIALQYALGLGLATLAVLQLPLRRFFRIVFLIPLTITPVGVGYMFLMMTDTSKGPLEPIWVALGLRDFTWVNDPWLARAAVIIGDTWQWTPFVFIVLLAALESLDQEVKEAALVDGAGRWQTFRHITVPAILPVTTTIVLIRMIEGFKIIDMPNILLGGGPGTATQSMTLEAYVDWNTLNLGRSAAIAYLLLILVSVVATVYVSFVRRRVTDLA
jgi:multiple sugar transport system permease protein